MESGKDRYYKFSSYGIRCLSVALATAMTLGMASCGRRGDVEDSKLRLSRQTTDSSASRSERVIKRSTSGTSTKERKTVKTLASTVKPSVVKTNPPSPQPVTEKKTHKQTETPETKPETAQPPATQPPATEPPVTQPPATQPPATEPPVTQPPATEPPVTQPSVTEPAETETPSADVKPTDNTSDDSSDSDIIVVDSSSTEEESDSEVETSSGTEFVLNDFVAKSLADIDTIEFGSAGSSLKITTSLVNFVESWPEDVDLITADPAKLSEAANLAIASMDETSREFLKQTLPVFYTEGQKLLNDRNLLEVSAKDAGVKIPEKLPTAHQFKQVVEAIATAANISLELPTETSSEEETAPAAPDSSDVENSEDNTN